jgi:hypothetical protein
MTPADLNALAVLAATAAAMISLGVKHRMLALRDSTRRCPACGRLRGSRDACACRE